MATNPDLIMKHCVHTFYHKDLAVVLILQITVIVGNNRKRKINYSIHNSDSSSTILYNDRNRANLVCGLYCTMILSNSRLYRFLEPKQLEHFHYILLSLSLDP